MNGIVLLVDRDTAFLSQAACVLSASGLPVMTASGARAALEALESDRDIRLALVELEAQDIANLELIGQMKALRTELKVIAICGALLQSALHMAEFVGADALLSKPLTNNWVDCIQTLLGM